MKRQMSVNLGNLLLSLSEVTDIASPTIAQHQHRTAFIALEMANNADLEPELIENIFMAALLHDIGAISIEEKIAIHEINPVDINLHCIRGELLLKQTPWLKKVSKIVRYHHRNWVEWDDSIDNPTVLSAQIILVADYAERLIDRNKYILHQHESIIEKVTKLRNLEVHSKVIDYFIEISKREEFWLDLVCPRLYPLLLHNGPYRNIEMGLEGISLIADLYRDIVDFKSNFTATHTSGVAACAELLSKLFGLTEFEVNLMRIAGNFHDIGKLIIPNSILEKSGKLTTDEFAIMKSHTYYTYYVLNSVGGFQQVAQWAAYHHEKLDGTGYPFRCKASELDTGCRIMTVADMFTAISEDRPYRKAMTNNEVYKVMKTQVEKGLIDSKIVELLFDNYDVVNGYVRNKQFLSKEFYEKRFLSVVRLSK